MASTSDTLNRETDARFWAQTGYKPHQKLDPSNPTDRAMMPVWRDIFNKVKAEDDAGTLVTTFDHPEVAQNLSDAAVANQAAGAHVDIAATAPDQATAQDNVVAATTAQQISTQKAQEAAAKQPPTVNPQLVQDASKQVANNPPPPQAPANEHIAHQHVHHGGAHRHARQVHAQAQQAQANGRPSRDALNKETNARFWAQTHYKPGVKLDMSIPEDAEMAKVWMAIFHQVQREADAGTLVFTSPDVAPPTTPPLGPPPVEPTPPPAPPPTVAPPQAAPPMAPPPGAVPPPMVPPPRPMPPMPPQGMPPPPPMWPMPPRMPPMHPMPPRMPPQGMPPMRPMPPQGMPPPQGGPQRGDDEEHRRGEYGKHRGKHRHRREAPDLQQPAGGPTLPPGSPGAPGPMAGPSAPGPTEGAPPGGPGPADSGLPPGTIPTDGGAPAPDVSPPPSGGLSAGKIALIALGVAVVGTVAYVGVKHKSGSSPSRSRPRRSPKVIVATPMRPTAARLGPSAASSDGAPALPPPSSGPRIPVRRAARP